MKSSDMQLTRAYVHAWTETSPSTRSIGAPHESCSSRTGAGESGSLSSWYLPSCSPPGSPSSAQGPEHAASDQVGRDALGRRGSVTFQARRPPEAGTSTDARANGTVPVATTARSSASGSAPHDTFATACVCRRLARKTTQSLVPADGHSTRKPSACTPGPRIATAAAGMAAGPSSSFSM